LQFHGIDIVAADQRVGRGGAAQTVRLRFGNLLGPRPFMAGINAPVAPRKNRGGT
jgi:hypothetical protein